MTAKNQARGYKAKKAGESFEDEFESRCKLLHVKYIKIPDACKRVYYQGKIRLIPEKSPFDYLITKEGRAAVLDCKTLDSKNFPYSMIKPHQREYLWYLYPSLNAGYLVWFRPLNEIVFFNARLLNNLQKNDSLKIAEGVSLGNIYDFQIERLFEYEHTDTKRTLF